MPRLLTILLLLALTACSLAPASTATPPAAQAMPTAPPARGPYRAPTEAASPAPVITRAPTATSTRSAQEMASPQPSATPDCASGLTFLADLTIPDGTSPKPGERLDKRWRVLNAGACNWDERFTLRLIAGPDLGASDPIPLFPARSGSEAVVRVIFTAPNDPGSYRSAWQAHDPLGQPFGDPIYIDIVVVAE